jgi:hypothetical protein
LLIWLVLVSYSLLWVNSDRTAEEHELREGKIMGMHIRG